MPCNVNIHNVLGPRDAECHEALTKMYGVILFFCFFLTFPHGKASKNHA